MTQEEKKTLEAKLDAFNRQRRALVKELNELINSKGSKKLEKEDLKREVAIRRKIDRLDARIDEIEERLDSERVNTRNKIFASVSIIALAGILGVVIGKSIKNCSSTQPVYVTKPISTTATKEPRRSNVIVEIPTTLPTAKVTAVPTPTPTPLLVNPADEEDVRDTAEVIYDENVEPMLNSINSNGLQLFFTRESVEDIIRMVNGELPKYNNYDDYTIAETANLMNDIFANQGNNNDLYPMDLSRLYPTGSKAATYIKTYDDIYRKIAEYRSEGNVDGFVEQCGLLASKVYNEWHLAGLYGGWNPYLFSYQKQYFLLQMATSRFSNYVREYLEANDLTVCIPACYDVEKQENRLVEIRDIFEALYMGTSKNGEISVMRSGDVVIPFAETYADAQDYFNRKNTYVKGLN